MRWTQNFEISIVALSWPANLLLCVLPIRNFTGEARMTCCIDHNAENAIPLFLCATCSRVRITGHRPELDTASVICAAVELGPSLEPRAHAP